MDKSWNLFMVDRYQAFWLWFYKYFCTLSFLAKLTKMLDINICKHQLMPCDNFCGFYINLIHLSTLDVS